MRYNANNNLRNMKNQNQECFPEFDIEKWDKKTFPWENKLFITSGNKPANLKYSFTRNICNKHFRTTNLYIF